MARAGTQPSPETPKYRSSVGGVSVMRNLPTDPREVGTILGWDPPAAFSECFRLGFALVFCLSGPIKCFQPDHSCILSVLVSRASN